MAVTLSERVAFWLKERDYVFKLKELYKAFPDTTPDSLRSLAHRAVKKLPIATAPAVKPAIIEAAKKARVRPITPPPLPIPPIEMDIPEDYKELVELCKYAKSQGLDTRLSDVLQYKKTRQEISDQPIQSNRPNWSRPVCLNERQQQIIDAIVSDEVQIVCIEGDRRTGKSTAVWVAIHEDLWNGTRKHWGFWAATERVATKIHEDIFSDPITRNETAELQRGHTLKRTDILDGSFIVNATTIKDSSGKKYHGIWIDEMHNVISENPKTLATVSAIVRSEPGLKIVMSMNKGTGAYMILMDSLKPLFEDGRARFFTLEKADTTHITDEADEICDILMRASAGDEFADMQLRNEAHPEIEPFPAPLIADAMNGYANWMRTIDGVMPYNTIVGVDPGFGHPTGVFIVGVYRDHYYEIESLLLKGSEISEDRLKSLIFDFANQYSATIVCESNSGGLYWQQDWRQRGIQCVAQNFSGTPANALHRSNMVRIIRDLLTTHHIHFKSTDLRSQLIKYDPGKKNDDSKGDLADAFIHAVYFAYTQQANYSKGGKTVWY